MEETDGKKKFVITRGMLLLGIIILLIIIVLIIILVKKFGGAKELNTDDFLKLEERMEEEAPVYVYQKNIELSEEEFKIELKDMLEENGGSINSDKVKAAKECDGYVIATKIKIEEYKAYIKCGNLYTTSGYVGSDNGTTKKTTTTQKDKEKPVITIIGSAELTLNVGDSYEELGAKALDNIDGDITSKINIKGSVDTSKPGTYTIEYEVYDGAGNKDTKKRTIIVKEKVTTTTTSNSSTKNTTTTSKKTTTKIITTTKPISAPVIILNGSKIINLEVGDKYIDPGYTASDGTGKNITSSVNVSGNVNTSASGTYIITYSVTDSYGNVAVTTRTIIVKSSSVSVSSISISPNSFELQVGSSKRLDVYISPTNATNKSVSWSSSNASVAVVSSDGTVTAKAKGTALITVKTSNGKTASSKVTVK